MNRLSGVTWMCGGLAVVLLVMCGVALADDGQYRSIGSEVGVGGLTSQEFLTRQSDLHGFLMTQMPAGADDVSISVALNEKDRAELEAAQADRTQSPMVVGVVKALLPPVAFTHGKDGGDSVWVTTVSSPGAVALRVHFTNVWIPQGAELYFFNDKGEAYGPYVGMGLNGTGEFWSNSVIGSTGTVMLRGSDLSGASLRINEIGHVATDFPVLSLEPGLTPVVRSFCSFNDTCVENNDCVNEPAVNDAESAVAKMRWIDGHWIYICSGGLLADSDAGSQIPYFLTANHCLSTDDEAATLEAYFQYSINCGSTACAPSFDPAPSPSTLGATVAATNSVGDFSLLTLNETPPAGSVFLGWNNSPIAYTNGADLHRVSHPSGAPQAYSHHEVDPSSPQCSGWPRGERIYSKDVFGATEGGSSGAPVVNAAGQVVGQLSGCCGYNCGDVCDTASNWTVDGALAHYWAEVEPFLGDGGGCTTNEDCDDLNDCTTDVCTAGVCSNTWAACGLADGCCGPDCEWPDDPDCEACGLPGEYCDTGADCCSGRCHPRKNYCR